MLNRQEYVRELWIIVFFALAYVVIFVAVAMVAAYLMGVQRPGG